MSRTKFLMPILILALAISLFAGCQAQNAEIPTEPLVSSQPTKPTEPSSEPTEPSDDVTDPTETIYPRTIEAIKSHIMPYMTYHEVRVMFGKKDYDATNTTDVQKARWYLEDGYYVTIRFYPTKNETWAEYLTTFPADDVSDEVFAEYFSEWYNHMEAYSAAIYKRTGDDTSRPGELIEVLFDYGYGPFWQEEE